MSFLSEDQLNKLVVERMILHVVGRQDEDFKPEVELTDLSQAAFFVDRIKGSTTSSVHDFNEGSPTKALLAEICAKPEDFEENAQELSRRFAKEHEGRNSADGAFFVILLGCDTPDTRFICLVKYDYREAVELYEREGKNAFRQIVQAFVKEKAAIQKFCLAKFERGAVCAPVAAFDRMGKAPDLTRYFSNFLDVKRNRDQGELSRQLKEAIRGTLEACKDVLPDGDVARANTRVSNILRGRDVIDEAAVSSALFATTDRPDDEDARAKLDKALRRKMHTANLDGIAFRPDQKIFAQKARRRVKTHEDVVLEFPGALEGSKVRFEPDPNGGSRIIISTDQEYVQDGTVPDRTGRRD